MSDITQITVSTERLLTPIDPDGAVIARGLHGNIIIDKINELAVEYGISTGSLNKIKVTDYNYRGSHGGSSLHLEDFRESINTINTLISRDGLTTTPISFSELARIKNFKTSDDVFIVRGLHLSVITSKLNVVIAEAGVSFTEEYQAVYDEFVVKPSSADAEAQNTFVKALVDGGVWTELDRLWILASHASDSDSLLDWIHPTLSANLATLVNDPSFTIKQGYTSNLTSSYISSNFAPSVDGVNFTNTGGSLSLYSRTTRPGDGNIYEVGTLQGGSTEINVQRSGTSPFSYWAGSINNSALANSLTGAVTGQGMYHVEKDSSDDVYTFLNDLDMSSGQSSVQTLSSDDLYILCRSNTATPVNFSPCEISFISIGVDIGFAKYTIFRNAFQALMTHYGTEV